MQTVTLDEAIIQLPQLIDDAVLRGEETIVLRDHAAVARIVPVGADGNAPVTKPASRLSHSDWLVLLHQAPLVSSEIPAPPGESLRREFLYEDRS